MDYDFAAYDTVSLYSTQVLNLVKIYVDSRPRYAETKFHNGGRWQLTAHSTSGSGFDTWPPPLSCQISTKSSNTWPSYCDFTNFPGPFFREGTMSPQFSELSGPNWAKFGEDIDQSSLLYVNVSYFRYVASFRNYGDSNATGSKTEANNSHL